MGNERNNKKTRKKATTSNATRKSTRLSTKTCDDEPLEVSLRSSSPVTTSEPTPSLAGPASDANDTFVDIDSDPITPPPKTVPKGRKRVVAELISDSDRDAPVVRKKKKTEEMAPDPHRRLILYIPQAESESTQRENLTHSTSFAEALEIIYDTVGCTDVSVKPKLSYKLSIASGKADKVNLTLAKDWDGCLEEVTAAEKNKKTTIISVRIEISEQYLVSLRARGGKGKAGAATKRGAKVAILDLEHADGDDDFDEGVGMMGVEAEKFDELTKIHSRCQMCGPGKACKIAASGAHHPLSNPQLRAWAHCLAAEMQGVTTHTPPKEKLFGMFYKKDFGPAAPEAAPPQLAAAFGAAPYMGNPYGYMPPWATLFGGNQLNAHAQAPNAHASTSALALPSSDPPDFDAANAYPDLTHFISRLSLVHPKRGLTAYSSTFEKLDFFNIDEIAKLQAQDLTKLVGISVGNATFLLVQVKAEMKRVDRVIRAARI